MAQFSVPVNILPDKQSELCDSVADGNNTQWYSFGRMNVEYSPRALLKMYPLVREVTGVRLNTHLNRRY